MENETKQRLDFLQSILDDSQDVIIAGDMDGKVVEFNRGAEILLGYKKDEVVGKPISMLYFNPPERDKLVKHLEEKGSVIDHDIKIRTKAGQMVHLSTTMSYLRDNHDHIIGTIGIAKDIGQRKKAEMRQYKYKRVFINSAVSVLVVGVIILATYLITAKVVRTAVAVPQSNSGIDNSRLKEQLTQATLAITNCNNTIQQLKGQLNESQQDLTQKATELNQAKKDLEQINQCQIYFPASAKDKNIIILKKVLPFTYMVKTYYWEGRLKEIKPDKIILIDTTDQEIPIPIDEIGGYWRR